MGGNNVKGLMLLENIYPPAPGQSIFQTNPKLKMALDKEMQKGTIKAPNPDEPEDVDEDMDAKIDSSVNEIWSYYDKKGVGQVDRSTCDKFFNDVLEVMAVRRGIEVKQLMAPGVSKKQCMDACFQRINVSGTGKISAKEFTDFVNDCDLEEATGIFCGQSGPKSVQALDQSKFVSEAEMQAMQGDRAKPVAGHVVFRNYQQEA